MTSSNDLEGSAEITEIENQGLGERYLDLMYKNKEKIHQVDAASGAVETHGFVRSKAIQVAMELTQKKLTMTDIVAVCSRQHSDQTAVILGTLFAGCIVAPIDPDVTHDECLRFFEVMKPKMVFCDVRDVGQTESVLLELEMASLCKVVVFGMDRGNQKSFENFLKHEADPNFQATTITNPKETVAFILQTQGTTGLPKMVCVSHSSIIGQVRNFQKITSGNAEKILTYLPLSHFAQAVVMCSCFEGGITRILASSFVERPACLLIHDLRIDHVFLGLDQLWRLSHHPALHDFDLSALKCVLITGAPITALSISQMRSSLHGVKVVQLYGLAEVGFVAAFQENDYNTALTLPSSVGKPLTGVKLKVVNSETRKSVSADIWGEILVKGSGMMLGYLKDPDGTNQAIEKGCFKTKDIGQYDSDGYIYVQGTTYDYLPLEHTKVNSSEIEEVFLSHPFVKEAALVTNGQELVACVIKKPEKTVLSEALMDFIMERVPDEKLPNRIKFMDAFPKTALGKLRRNALKELVFNARIKQTQSMADI